MMKTCIKCGVTKPLAEFNKHASKKDGVQSHCKDCTREYATNYRANNPDTVKSSGAEWRAKNKEKLRAKWESYSSKNKEKLRTKSALYYATNKEKASAATAKWFAANPEARRIFKQTRRAREVSGRLSRNIVEKLHELQRGKCACGCKQPLGDDYHLDHRMPLALGGSNTDDNMQLLRKTCNLQKSAKHPVDFAQQRGFLL